MSSNLYIVKKKTTLPERLQLVMDEQEWNQVELGKAMGCSRQHVWNLMNVRSKTLEPRLAFNLQDKHRYSARWLLCGDGDIRLEVVSAEDRKLIESLRNLPPERRQALATALGI